VPVAETFALFMVGLCSVEVKPFELVHAYVPTPPPVRFRVVPAQMGELLLAVAVGKALTITATEAVLVQPATFVTVIV
jgi:hypothetical protein